MMLSRDFFFFVTAAVCGLAPVQDCLAQKLANVDPFVLPLQTYAAIDLSGSSTGSNPVDQIALADNNNAAFSFWSSSNYMVGKCVNGTLVEPPKQTGSATTAYYNYGGTFTATLDAVYKRVLNSHGDVGTFGGLDNPQSATGPVGAVIWPYGTTFSAALQPDIQMPWGFYAYPKKQGVVSLNDSGGLCGIFFDYHPFAYWDERTIFAIAPAGGGCGQCIMPPSVASDISPMTYLNDSVDWTSSLSGDCLLKFRVGFNSVPITLTYVNYFVGTGGWTKLALPNNDLAGAFNDSHDVLVGPVYDPVTQLSTGAYLFDKDGHTLPFNSDGTHAGLIPKLAQPYLRNIYPFLLSNRVSPPTDGTVKPVLHILVSAQIHRHPDSNTWDTSTFLLRLLSDGTTDLQEVTYPDGFTNLQLKSINTSGVIAAISNDGHALLLVPIYVTADTDDNYQVDLDSTANSSSNSTSAVHFDSDPSPQVKSPADQVLTYVRFGLWDHAFDSSNNIRNVNDEANNFVGADSRRFYFSIAAKIVSSGNMTLHWYTDSDPGGNDTLTLTQSSADPSLFATKALMLVSDDADKIPVNTGLQGGKNANPGDADYRLRKASLGDKVHFKLTSNATGATLSTIDKPIFDPKEDRPDSVEKLDVQVVNTRNTIDGNLGPEAPERAPYITNCISVIKQRYAAIGVDVNVAYNSLADVLYLPKKTKSNPQGINLYKVKLSEKVFSPDELDIVNALKSKYGSNIGSGRVLYLIIVGNFDYHTMEEAKGESFPSAQIMLDPSDAPAANCIFIAQATQEKSVYTPAHEIGHMLLNRVPQDMPVLSGSPDPNPHYVGNQEGFNLMRSHTTGTGHFYDPKRMWDDKTHFDGSHSGSHDAPVRPYQAEYLRQSPLLH